MFTTRGAWRVDEKEIIFYCENAKKELTFPLRNARLSLVQEIVARGLEPVTSHWIVYSLFAIICFGFWRITTVWGRTEQKLKFIIAR